MNNSIIDATKLTDYCCSDPNFNRAMGSIGFAKNNELFTQLYSLKDKSDGETKCTICKAIQELEKPKTELHNNTNFDWVWLIMLMMFAVGPNFNNNSDMFDTFAKACAEVYRKEKEDNTDDLSSDAE